MNDPIPFLNWESIQQVAEDHDQLMAMVSYLQARYRMLASQIDDGGLTEAAVAITQEVIPARDGLTPGGPVSVVIQASTDGSDFEAETSVEVYSWVKTDSPDPADGWSGYIFITQDRRGTWWYHAIDCVSPPPAYEDLPDGETIGDTTDEGTAIYYVTD